MNKYLHAVASVGFLFTLNHDARNHELKIYNTILSFKTVATVNRNVRQKGSILCITLMIRLILFIFTAAFDLY